MYVWGCWPWVPILSETCWVYSFIGYSLNFPKGFSSLLISLSEDVSYSEELVFILLFFSRTFIVLEVSPSSGFTFANSCRICSIFSLVFVLLLLRPKPCLISGNFIKGFSLLGIGIVFLISIVSSLISILSSWSPMMLRHLLV